MSVRTSNDEPREGFPLLPLAEGALTLVTVATVATMWRLFADGSYFPPLAAHAIAAHVVAITLRRRGISPSSSALVALMVALGAVIWGHLGSTTSYGFPTGDTAAAAADQLELAWRTFGEVRAPAPVLEGFVLSAAAAIWIGAWLADLAAFRLWTPFEALIPSGTLFLFASLFSADRARLLAAVVWMTAALAFVLLHRTARQQHSPSWLGSDARIGTRSLIKVGAALSVLAVLGGWMVGPRLPGADAEALVPVNPDDDGGSRTTISPLVEIRGRLVDQSQSEMFSVLAGQRAYWRMTSLDIFDGEVWSSRGSFGRAEGNLPGAGIEGVTTTPVSQRFTITGLSTIWLPAAYEAGRVEIEGADIRWDDVSATLIVSTDFANSDGLTYDVTSDVPTFDPAALEQASGDIPDDVASRALELPDDFPAPVAELARQVVAGATTPYDQALALQNFFRDGSFTYSLAPPSGHSNSAIESFLFTTRTGYCEQFAGSYAAMARAIGLPARVAVGFTPGEPDPTQAGRYVVRGENAHAWPEVWINGAGWVAFEPTPGRGAPGAQGYTGVEEQQDTAGISTDPTTVPADATTPTSAATQPGTGPSTTLAGLGDVGAEPDPLGTGPQDDGTDWGAILGRAALVVGGTALLVVGAGATVAIGRIGARRRRRARAATPEELVDAVWAESVELGPLVGVIRRPFETPFELGRRLAQATGQAVVARLAQLVTRSAFDPKGISDDEATEAVDLAAEIRVAVTQRTTRWQRLRAAVDPRPPERRRRAARSVGPRVQIKLASAGER